MKKIFRKINIWTKPFQDFINKICIRVMHPEIVRYIRFVKQNYAKGKKCRIRTAYGRGWKNVVIILDKKYVFKFPFASRDRSFVKRVSIMEKNVVDAFRKVSPIYIPKMELIDWDGLIIRKFEYVSGKQITDFNPDKISVANCKKIAKQLADFIWIISQSDPEELRKFKVIPNEKPDFSRGWAHADLATNFLLDSNFNIVAVIDWEDTYWVETKWFFSKLNKSLTRRGYYDVVLDTIFEYVFDYLDSIKTKHTQQ